MTVYYISGPMRGKKDYNRKQFFSVEAALKDNNPLGTNIINPARNFGGRVDLTPSEYMELDLAQVLDADVIVQLPGWQQSEGAVREAQLGVWTGKKFLEARFVESGIGEWVFMSVPAPTFSESPRGSVLDEAKQLVTGDRNAAYGPPTQDFDRTAAMASAFGFQVDGNPLTSHHVAIFMILLKMSRLSWTPTKRDSWVDTAGYAACGLECAVTEEEERLKGNDCE